MCSIAGFVTSTPRVDPAGVLLHMARIITHRGPDDEGSFQATTRSRAYLVGLAHRYLSIAVVYALKTVLNIDRERPPR